jgi:hypothetical protein
MEEIKNYWERHKSIAAVMDLLEKGGFAVSGVTSKPDGSMAIYCLPPKMDAERNGK